MVVYGSTKTFIWSCVIRRPSVLIDNLWARSDPTIALTLPHMATHADTINHSEYELETRGMPFETGRTSMASACSFSPNLVSLSLSLSLSLPLLHIWSMILQWQSLLVCWATLTRDTWKIKNASHKTTISPRSLFLFPVSLPHSAWTSELNSRGRLNFEPLSPAVFSARSSFFPCDVLTHRMFRKQRSRYNVPINEMIFMRSPCKAQRIFDKKGLSGGIYKNCCIKLFQTKLVYL